jgi:GrpB-like predicted nucleotidyltransferase (UPF0157 family)
MKVQVQPYDSNWPHQFEALRQRIWPAVSSFATSIEHVGSTSVPGLAAKPVIDIDIIIPVLTSLPQTIAALATLGYSYHGDQGIPGREAFKLNETPRTHHLYVCPQGSLPLSNHLTLRDHLRANPEDRAAYSRLKFDLARQHPHDIDSYIRGKTDFILDILARHGFPSATLDSIRSLQ